MRGRVVVSAMLVLCFLPALAQAAPGLFDARVAVESESRAERDEATREGLRSILVRLTGREVPEEQEATAALLADASRYVQQYGYGDAQDQTLELRVRFDGSALQRELMEREVPFWSVEERPRTVAWVAINAGGDRLILGGEQGEDFQEILRSAATEGGLPVIFPLMDLQDQQAVSSSDIWGGFRDPILEASERYDSDAVLVGRVVARGDRWRGRWILFWNGERHEWTVDREEADEVLATGMTTGITQLAGRYARIPDPDATGQITVRVQNISDLNAYARVERYLQGLRGVETVDVVRVGGDGVDFRLRVQGLPGRAFERIRSGRLLVELKEADEDAVAADGDVSPDYYFQLSG